MGCVGGQVGGLLASRAAPAAQKPRFEHLYTHAKETRARKEAVASTAVPEGCTFRPQLYTDAARRASVAQAAPLTVREGTAHRHADATALAITFALSLRRVPLQERLAEEQRQRAQRLEELKRQVEPSYGRVAWAQ